MFPQPKRSKIANSTSPKWCCPKMLFQLSDWNLFHVFFLRILWWLPRHKGLHNRRDLQRSRNPTSIGPSKGQNDLRRHQYRVAPGDQHYTTQQKKACKYVFDVLVLLGKVVIFILSMYFFAASLKEWYFSGTLQSPTIERNMSFIHLATIDIIELISSQHKW